MIEIEEWRYVPNFPKYVVSNLGNIKRAGNGQGRPIKLDLDRDGAYVNLHLPFGDSEARRFRLDRLVARAFLRVPGNLCDYYPLHKDGNLENCRVDNLEWVKR